MWCPQHNQYCYEDTCPHGGPRPEVVRWKLPPYPATPTEREALAKRQAALGVAACEPCPRGADKPEPTCTNRHQCWEPCGELGNSEEHVRVGQEPRLITHGVPEDQRG